MLIHFTIKNNNSSCQTEELTIIWRQGLCHILRGCGLEEEGGGGVLVLDFAVQPQFKCQLVTRWLTSVGAGLLESIV